MSSDQTSAWSPAKRRPQPDIMKGADGVDDDIPGFTFEDYDAELFGVVEKSVPASYNFDSRVPYSLHGCRWPDSPTSLGGSSEEMNSASSSPATSNPPSNTSLDGYSFLNLQLFELAIGASQSCPPSITTSPVSQPLSEDSDPGHLFNYFDAFYLPPPMHTLSAPPSAASRTSDTERSDNCDPIHRNLQVATTFPPFLFPSSFMPVNGHTSASTSGHHVPGDQCSDSGEVEYPNPMEPRPPDHDHHFGNWQIAYGFPLQAGDGQDSLLRPSSLTTNDAGGCSDERPPRGRRCRSVPNLESVLESVPVKTVHNRAPYHSRSPSRKRAEPQGYRDRVSTEAFKKVSEARRTAPAPHQCPICFDTFTRADGLQNHIDRHNGQGKKTRCNFCNEERTTISRHMKNCAMNPDRDPPKSSRSKKSCSPF